MQLNKEEKQSQELNQEQRAKRLDILDQIKSQVTNRGQKLTFDDTIFEVWSLIGGFGDFVGREFDIIYENDKIVKVIQKPIRTKLLLRLFKLFENYCKRQENMYKKNQPRTLGRRK